MRFEVHQVANGVLHIRDAMGVCMTLLIGKKAALLVDTGYGVEDVAAFVRTLTDLPLTVLLTHHHHDHVLGARWFDKTLMFPEDLSEWPVFTSLERRQAVYVQAVSKGLDVDEAQFLQGNLATPEALQAGCLDLGDMAVEIIHCPGHTPGSSVVYLPQQKLLLTGDNWNPCTWLFFDAALPVQMYRENIRQLQSLDFDRVLCSHQLDCYPRTAFDTFAEHLTEETLNAAKSVTIGGYERFDTRQADVAEGQIIVFDWSKYRKDDVS